MSNQNDQDALVLGGTDGAREDREDRPRGRGHEPVDHQCLAGWVTRSPGEHLDAHVEADAVDAKHDGSRRFSDTGSAPANERLWSDFSAKPAALPRDFANR